MSNGVVQNSQNPPGVLKHHVVTNCEVYSIAFCLGYKAGNDVNKEGTHKPNC